MFFHSSKRGSRRISSTNVSSSEVRQNGCSCSKQTSRDHSMTVTNAYNHKERGNHAERPRLPVATNTTNEPRMSLDYHQYQMMDDEGNACGGKSLPDDDDPAWRTSMDYNYVYTEPKVYWDKFRKKKAVIRTLDDVEERYAPCNRQHDRRHDTVNEKVDDDSMVTNMLYRL